MLSPSPAARGVNPRGSPWSSLSLRCPWAPRLPPAQEAAPGPAAPAASQGEVRLCLEGKSSPRPPQAPGGDSRGGPDRWTARPSPPPAWGPSGAARGSLWGGGHGSGTARATQSPCPPPQYPPVTRSPLPRALWGHGVGTRPEPKPQPRTCQRGCDGLALACPTPGSPCQAQGQGTAAPSVPSPAELFWGQSRDSQDAPGTPRTPWGQPGDTGDKWDVLEKQPRGAGTHRGQLGLAGTRRDSQGCGGDSRDTRRGQLGCTGDTGDRRMG